MDYEEQYDKIYRYCYFRVKDSSKAEDLTQETFLRFLESTNYMESGKGLNYLYTIARNLCIDDSRKTEPEPLDDSVFMSQDDSFETVNIRLALEAMDAQDRELLFLRYVNEVPVGELSKFYGVSRFTLYRRLKRIKKELKNELKEVEYEPKRKGNSDETV